MYLTRFRHTDSRRQGLQEISRKPDRELWNKKRPFRGNKEDLNPAERTEDEEKKWDAGTRLPPL